MSDPPAIQPRLLSREEAAAYCGVSPASLDANCPVKPIRIGRRALWDRRALDTWLDGASGLAPTVGSLTKKLREMRG